MKLKDKNRVVVSWDFLERHDGVEEGGLVLDEGVFYEVELISLEAEIVVLNIL